jgi:SAM-dependent methyltransferase
VDREPQQIPGARFIQADLEDGSPWPLPDERFEAVVVTNYLHRKLFARIQNSLQPGGVLIYETFMLGNERFGKPSNPAFLLLPGELLGAFPELTVKGFEEGAVEMPKPAMIQRLCAVRAGKG